MDWNLNTAENLISNIEALEDLWKYVPQDMRNRLELVGDLIKNVKTSAEDIVDETDDLRRGMDTAKETIGNHASMVRSALDKLGDDGDSFEDLTKSIEDIQFDVREIEGVVEYQLDEMQDDILRIGQENARYTITGEYITHKKSEVK